MSWSAAAPVPSVSRPTVLDDAELTAQHSTLMSPLVWDLAHVGNYEELWLLRATTGAASLRPEIDPLYDAFEHPRATRPSLPLLTPAESLDYLGLVRRQVLDTLERVRLDDPEPLLASGFVYRMVLQHEHQHDETMLATHQLRRGARALPDTASDPPPRASRWPAEVLVPAGSFVMGTSTDPWALDNERPAHRVDLPGVLPGHHTGVERRLPRLRRVRRLRRPTPVEHRRLAVALPLRKAPVRPSGSGIPAAGCVDGSAPSSRCRTTSRCSTCATSRPTPTPGTSVVGCPPRRSGRRRRPGTRPPGPSDATPGVTPIPGPEHANLGQTRTRPAPVGSFPAGASAYGVLQLLGDVWEWTSTDFTGHPGFCTYPYREYSEVFFGSDHKVLRGGSWATDPLVCRSTFRNWDYPIRRQIFAGFRTARDA